MLPRLQRYALAMCPFYGPSVDAPGWDMLQLGSAPDHSPGPVVQAMIRLGYITGQPQKSVCEIIEGSPRELGGAAVHIICDWRYDLTARGYKEFLEFMQ